MNKELIEKLSSIREDLLAFQAQVTDVKKLSDLVIPKVPTMRRNYEALHPYMTEDQKHRSYYIGGFYTHAEICLAVLKSPGESLDEGIFLKIKTFLTDSVTRFVPLMIADLDDIAKNLRVIT